VLAAFRFVSHYPAEVFNHVVALADSQGQVHLLRQGFHCFQAVLVLGVGVDIGVVPQGTDLIPLLPPVFDGIGGAVGTATMN